MTTIISVVSTSSLVKTSGKCLLIAPVATAVWIPLAACGGGGIEGKSQNVDSSSPSSATSGTNGANAGEPSTTLVKPMVDGCGHYTGANPTYAEFVADIQQYFDAAGWESEDPASTALQVKEELMNIPPGGAAKYTQYICQHLKSPPPEQIAQTGARYYNVIGSQRGYALYGGLLGCRPGARPEEGFATNLDIPDMRTTAEVIRTTLCGQ